MSNLHLALEWKWPGKTTKTRNDDVTFLKPEEFENSIIPSKDEIQAAIAEYEAYSESQSAKNLFSVEPEGFKIEISRDFETELVKLLAVIELAEKLSTPMQLVPIWDVDGVKHEISPQRVREVALAYSAACISARG